MESGSTGVAHAKMKILIQQERTERAEKTLNRFRPWSAEPFATMDLFK